MQRLIPRCALWCLLAVSLASPASAAVLSSDIAPQPLAEALTAFAEQTGLQLFYLTAIAETQQSGGARAGTSPSAALAQLLEGTGLQFTFINARAVRIFAPDDTASSTTTEQEARRRTNSWFALEEVVVTATRREEQVSKVPVSIAVWTEEAMEASGVKGMTEIAALTPGVEFGFDPGFGDWFTNIAIRGVTDMNGTAIGIFLDDTPIPPGRGDTFLRSFPLTFDLDRVEVLRGPQGTLLGERTLGGAVRFIPNQPSLTTFTGLVRTELASTARGDASYEAGAAAGGPVIPDVLGFRVSGWYRSDGGYVDRVDPFTGTTLDDNANRSVSKSIRGALTWAPTDSLRVTPSLTYQSVGIRDPSGFETDFSGFETDLSRPEAGELRHAHLVQRPFNDTFHLAALKLTAGFGTTELSTVTSYFHRTAAAVFDGDDDQADLRQTVFSQEARLTSDDPTAALSWVAGVWYSSARNRLTTRTSTGQDDIYVAGVTDETQLDAFGQIALRMTERLTASAGLRIGRAKYDAATEVPPILGAEVAETPVAPRFGLSYQPDERNLFYLTVAKGYASGGIYLPVVRWQEAPEPYAPHALWSYEIGAKNGLLDGRIDLDTSVFHIRYNYRPSDDTSAATPLGARGAAAINGFNLAARALLTERVRVGLAIAYTDAHYTQSVQADGAVAIGKGDALGRGSPWNVTASIEHDFAVASGVTASVRAEDIFHSQNPGPFSSDRPGSPYYSPAPPDPSTNVLNLRANVKWSSFDVALFVKNALDSQPTLMLTSFGDASTFRPRAVGMSASWRF